MSARACRRAALGALLVVAGAGAVTGAAPQRRFALAAQVRFGDEPMPASVLEVPSLALRAEADSLGRLRLDGAAPAGCRYAQLHVLAWGSAVWSFDPARPRTLDAGAIVLPAEDPPSDPPLRVILGCPIPAESLRAWSAHFRGVDTLKVLGG